jgi:hypothetical protein
MAVSLQLRYQVQLFSLPTQRTFSPELDEPGNADLRDHGVGVPGVCWQRPLEEPVQYTSKISRNMPTKASVQAVLRLPLPFFIAIVLPC